MRLKLRARGKVPARRRQTRPRITRVLKMQTNLKTSQNPSQLLRMRVTQPTSSFCLQTKPKLKSTIAHSVELPKPSSFATSREPTIARRTLMICLMVMRKRDQIAFST